MIQYLMKSRNDAVYSFRARLFLVELVLGLRVGNHTPRPVALFSAVGTQPLMIFKLKDKVPSGKY